MFALRQSRIKKHWTDFYRRNEKDLVELIEEDYPWRDWEANYSPEATAAFEFETGIRILAGSDNRALANRYFARSIQIVNRIFDEDRLTAPGCVYRFPRNRGSATRTHSYAQVVLGQQLDEDALRSASRDFENHCLATHRREHLDEQTSFDWINAIHLALLAGDVERGGRLLTNLPEPFGHHERHRAVLHLLISLADRNDIRQTEDEVARELDRYYDDIRNPRKKRTKGYYMPPTLGPLEIGLLRDKYLTGKDGSVDWTRTIESYTR